MRFKRVRCKSGLLGEQSRLQDNYADCAHPFEAFTAYAQMYGLHTRLGYKTIVGAWRANPVVQGSVIPSDFRVVRPKPTRNAA